MDLFLISGMVWFHCMFSWRVGVILFLCLVGVIGISRFRLPQAPLHLCPPVSEIKHSARTVRLLSRRARLLLLPAALANRPAMRAPCRTRRCSLAAGSARPLPHALLRPCRRLRAPVALCAASADRPAPLSCYGQALACLLRLKRSTGP